MFRAERRKEERHGEKWHGCTLTRAPVVSRISRMLEPPGPMILPARCEGTACVKPWPECSLPGFGLLVGIGIPPVAWRVGCAGVSLPSAQGGWLKRGLVAGGGGSHRSACEPGLAGMPD